MEKVLIFGIGKRYLEYKVFLEDNFDIVGYIDNNPRDNAYSVDHIFDFHYDSIIITPIQCEEMVQQLLDLDIDPKKIIVLDVVIGSYGRKSIGLISYGQHFEDLVIAGILGMIEIKKPSYLDLGSNHPIRDSNTYLFYKNGCNGVCVDANPLTIEMFRKVRPGDVCVATGVSDCESTLPFYCFDDYSGRNTFSKDMADRYIELSKAKIIKILNIPVVTLSTIVDKYCGGAFPDFLDCDVEGYDYAVLNSYDLKKNGPKVACVEIRADDIAMFDELFDMYGYFRYCRMGANNIYVRKEFSQKLIHMNL